MKYEKYVKDNYSFYLSNNIDSDVSIVVRFDEKDDDLNQIKDNQCIIVIKPDRFNDILKIIEEVENFINQMKNRKINPNIVIISNEMIDVKKFNNERLSFVVEIDDNIKKDNEANKEIEEEEPFEKFWKVNVIKKEDNGILKSYNQINAVEEKKGVYKVIVPEVTSDGTATNNDVISPSSDVFYQYDSSLNDGVSGEEKNGEKVPTDEQEEEKQNREELSEKNKKNNVRRLVRTPTYMSSSGGFVSIFGISIIFIIIFIFILFIVM